MQRHSLGMLTETGAGLINRAFVCKQPNNVQNVGIPQVNDA